MKTLCTFGLIGAYIACAFVPPTSQSVIVSAAEAQSMIQETARTSLLAPELQDTKKIRDAVKTLEALSKNPAFQAAINSSSSTSVNPESIKAASSILKASLPTVINRARNVAKNVTKKNGPTPAWRSLMQSTSDPALKNIYEMIEQARTQKNAGRCREVDRLARKYGGLGMTRGDLLALCLGFASANEGRCRQIDAKTAASLKNVCTIQLEKMND